MVRRRTKFKVGDKVVGMVNAGIFKGVKGTITYIAPLPLFTSPEGQYGDIHTNMGANLAVWFKHFKRDEGKRKARKMSSPPKYGW